MRPKNIIHQSQNCSLDISTRISLACWYAFQTRYLQEYRGLLYSTMVFNSRYHGSRGPRCSDGIGPRMSTGYGTEPTGTGKKLNRHFPVSFFSSDSRRKSTALIPRWIQKQRRVWLIVGQSREPRECVFFWSNVPVALFNNDLSMGMASRQGNKIKPFQFCLCQT